MLKARFVDSRKREAVTAANEPLACALFTDYTPHVRLFSLDIPLRIFSGGKSLGMRKDRGARMIVWRSSFGP